VPPAAVASRKSETEKCALWTSDTWFTSFKQASFKLALLDNRAKRFASGFNE
jgi:hypothetical protein